MNAQRVASIPSRAPKIPPSTDGVGPDWLIRFASDQHKPTVGKTQARYTADGRDKLKRRSHA